MERDRYEGEGDVALFILASVGHGRVPSSSATSRPFARVSVQGFHGAGWSPIVQVPCVTECGASLKKRATHYVRNCAANLDLKSDFGSERFCQRW